MTASPLRGSADLAAVVTLALAGLLAALLPAPDWARAALLLPLVLLLPGYALSAALFLPAALPAAERVVYSVALSVTATGLGGVAAQLAIGLRRPVWALVLVLIVGAASGTALARRRRVGASWSAPPASRRLAARRALPGLPPIALAAALAAWSVQLSSEGAREERHRDRFSELWALPAGPAGQPGRTSVSVGVGNEEGEPVSYRVRVSQSGSSLAEWRVRLADGRRWRGSLAAPPISPAEPLRVVLLRDGEVYRRTVLREGELAS